MRKTSTFQYAYHYQEQEPSHPQLASLGGSLIVAIGDVLGSLWEMRGEEPSAAAPQPCYRRAARLPRTAGVEFYAHTWFLCCQPLSFHWVSSVLAELYESQHLSTTKAKAKALASLLSIYRVSDFWLLVTRDWR